MRYLEILPSCKAMLNKIGPYIKNDRGLGIVTTLSFTGRVGT